MSGIFDSSLGFAPFYDQTVAVSGDTHAGTYKACVLEDGLDDPLSESTGAAERRLMSFHLPKRGDGGWNSDTPPARGYTVTLTGWGGIPGDIVFTVKSVEDFGDAWVLKAREGA